MQTRQGESMNEQGQSVEDQRHSENQQRFEAIERTLKEIKDFTQFLADAKVGLRWAGKFGRFVIFASKVVGGGVALYAAWRYGGGGK